MALDGSGSLRQGGFDILKKFIKKLLERYETEYFGSEAVKIGIVLFGSGVIMPDGKTVSPAILSQPRRRCRIQDSRVQGAEITELTGDEDRSGTAARVRVFAKQ